MASRILYLVATGLHRLNRRVWRARRSRIGKGDVRTIKKWRRQAREMRNLLARVEDDIERQLNRRSNKKTKTNLPADITYFYRPEAFLARQLPRGIAAPGTNASFGTGLAIHHDIPEPEFTLRQIANPPEYDTGFALVLDAYAMGGSFLSISVTLPDGEASKTRRDELVRLNYDMDMDRPLEAFVRLNLRHGPNVEQIVREVDFGSSERWVEFDIIYTRFDPKRGVAIWLDLIFQVPSMNEIRIRDLSVTRRPRLSL